MKRAAIYLRRAGVIGRFRANACPAAGRHGAWRPVPADISVAAGEYFRRRWRIFPSPPGSFPPGK